VEELAEQGVLFLRSVLTVFQLVQMFKQRKLDGMDFFIIHTVHILVINRPTNKYN
jgi:hypothetical protein